jgi:hypothetical protein
MAIQREYPITDLLAVARANSGWSFGPDGVLAERLANTLRVDWDPATGAHRGLLLEGAAINRVPNPWGVGGTIGAGLPTGWSWSGAGLSSILADLRTLPNGLPYAEILISGTASNANSVFLTMVPIGGGAPVPITLGDDYSFELGVEVLALSSSLGNPLIIRPFVGGASTFVNAGFTAGAVVPVGQAFARQRASDSMDNAASTCATGGLVLSGHTSGDAVSARVGVSFPALLAGTDVYPYAFPGDTTRLPDNVSFIDVQRWLTPDAGTFVIDFTPNDVLGGDRELLTVDDGTSSNRIRLSLIAGGTTVRLRSIVGGVIAGTVAMASGPALQRHTVRASYGSAGLFLSVNGAAPISTAVPVPPGLQRAFLGNAAGGNHLNGWIGPRVEYLPRQYTDAAAADGYTIRDR